MAAARQIIELLRSHIDGDDERFRTAAYQIAANEAKQGHDGLAKEIQKLVDQSRRTSSTKLVLQDTNSVPFARPHGELAGILEMVQPVTRLTDLVLSPALEKRLQRVVKEQKQFGLLREHDLVPRQRLLLLGPPGCGKTVTAHALAHELGLPLFVVRLDALFTKFLGETASKLRLIFDEVEKHRAVFLFDEFDSLGLSRGSENDVAEMRRVLNSFLVFIDNMKGYSLIIAASNHPDALDAALFRRFDDIIEYSMPSLSEIQQVLERRLSNEKGTDLDWPKILNAGKRLSFAEASRIATDAIKEKLIENLDALSTDLILKAIQDRTKIKRPKQKK